MCEIGSKFTTKISERCHKLLTTFGDSSGVSIVYLGQLNAGWDLGKQLWILQNQVTNFRHNWAVGCLFFIKNMLGITVENMTNLTVDYVD